MEKLQNQRQSTIVHSVVNVVVFLMKEFLVQIRIMNVIVVNTKELDIKVLYVKSVG